MFMWLIVLVCLCGLSYAYYTYVAYCMLIVLNMRMWLSRRLVMLMWLIGVLILLIMLMCMLIVLTMLLMMLTLMLKGALKETLKSNVK